MFSFPVEKKSLASRAFWLLVAKTVAYVISFALPLILVRRLDQTSFGLYKQAFQIINTAVVILPVGFMMSAYYFLPRETTAERRGAVVTNILFFYYLLGALAFLLLLFWPGVLAYFAGEQDSRVLIRYAPLIGLTIFFWVGSSFLEVIAVANEESHLATLFIINAQVTKTGFLVVAAIWFGSVRGLLGAALLQGFVQALVLQAYLRSRFGSYWQHFDGEILKEQLVYVLPLGAAGILQFSLMDIHNYFIMHYFSAADYAIYSLGGFTTPLVGIIATSVTAVLIPQISYLQSRGEIREILVTTARAMRKLAACYFPIYVFFLVMGREVILVMFTERYVATWPFLLVNITLIPFLAMVGDPIIRAFAAHRFFMLKVRVAEILLMFCALWWSTTRYGMMGTIITAVAFLIFDRAIEAFRAWTIAGATLQDVGLLRDWLKIAVSALLAGLAIFLAHPFALAWSARLAGVLRPFRADPTPLYTILLCGAVFVFIYISLLVLLKTPTPGERAALANLPRRVKSLWRRPATLEEPLA
jgi:O-antigen/teichoic acid export membrane protein